MIISTIVMTEWIMIMIPPSMTSEIDEAKGLKRIMIPQIKSITPSSSHRYQLETPFLTVMAILIILTLDRIIQIPSAIVKIVDKTFGIAIMIKPTTIDKIPATMP